MVEAEDVVEDSSTSRVIFVTWIETSSLISVSTPVFSVKESSVRYAYSN